MNNLIHFLIPGLVFIFLYCLLQTSYVKQLLINKIVYFSILFGIILVQLVTIFSIQQQVGDVMLFSGAGYYFRHGVDFYWIDKDHTQYPFFPFLIFFHAFANSLTYLNANITFMMYLKILLLIALHFIGFLINRHHRSESLTLRRQLQLDYLINPITYAVIFFHGQIDVILIAFLIAALMVLQKKSLRRVVFAGLLYAASVATKTWSVIFIPLLAKYFGFTKTFVILLITSAFLFTDVFIYTRMVFGSAFRVVLPAVLKPGGPVGIWGISFLLKPWATYLMSYNLYIFATLMGIGTLLIWLKKTSLWRSIILTIIWVYLVIPNWGVQYLFWIVPFLYIDKTPLKRLFLSIGGIYIWLNYMSIAANKSVIPEYIIHLIGFLLWLLLGISFIWLYKFNPKLTK